MRCTNKYSQDRVKKGEPKGETTQVLQIAVLYKQKLGEDQDHSWHCQWYQRPVTNFPGPQSVGLN